jgi:hypothetical protein
VEELKMFVRTIGRIKMWLGWCPLLETKNREKERSKRMFVHKTEERGIRRIRSGRRTKYKHLLLGITVPVTIVFMDVWWSILPSLLSNTPLKTGFIFLLGLSLPAIFFFISGRMMIKEVEEKGKFRRGSYQLVMAFFIVELFMMKLIINSIGKEFLTPLGLAIPLSLWVLYFQITAWERKYISDCYTQSG